MDKRKEIRTPQSEVDEAVALVKEHGSKKNAARVTGKSYSWFQRRLRLAETQAAQPIVRGRVRVQDRQEWQVPDEGVKRYIFTCAQNNTHLHDGVWENLQALSQHYDASIHVSTFTYDKASYGKGSVKSGKEATAGDMDDVWYDSRVLPYRLDESVIVAPGLVWCGEMNILPTAVRPLSGLEAYTGRASGIFPHVKFAMDSVAAAKSEGTKFNYTTGTVTQRNYIAKKAGQKAEFHHGYGALLVEVDSDGTWFCRQLNADSEGTIYDLTLCARNGGVTDGHHMEAITWGDIHVGTIPKNIVELNWGEGGMIDMLRPKYQFMHDVLDFRSQNHHDRNDPHKKFRKFCEGTGSVGRELKAVAHFLDQKSHRAACQTIVVDSNHDNALMRWLREADYRNDPENALFFLAAQSEVYKSIFRKDRNFHLVEWAMRELKVGDDIRFLRPDESFIICKDAGGGIECGMHGHLGVNGARATLRQFALMGRKSNTGHGHAAGIYDGAYRAGITGSLDQGYNAGPSSWSVSHIGTYPNGKRVILTTYDGKWRAI